MRASMGLRWAQRALCVLALGLTLVPAAHGHLMAAQRGTLNIVGTGGFMVVSLPVSAFTGVDDDRDGMLSPAELHLHAGAIQAQVHRGVHLRESGAAQPLQLQDVQMHLSSPDHAAAGAARQVVVLGRFALGEQQPAMRLRLALFGTASDERAQEITVSRGDQVQRLLLAPGRDEGEILPSAWASFIDHLMQGMAHVLSGADHLLFLLVVLASGWGPRQLLWALSIFTLGHGITLTAAALGGLTVPSAIVEPAIAATIVGMALYDRSIWRRRQSGAMVAGTGVRLALVFACALIHGLGLAGALGDLGLDRSHRVWSLAGFNAGIEAGQLVVALGVVAAFAGIRHVCGSNGLALTTRIASYAAMTAGSFWLVQRAMVAA